jgi:CelD/BcsL family acetyltransferase involved in cellulose biosynthesis
MLRIALLRLGQRPVAMQIAAEWRNRFWLFKIAHDRDFDDCSPGQLLMRHTLLHAAHAGLKSYELMGVMDDWTRLWTRQTRQYLRVQALPFSVNTAVVLARRTARAGVDRLRRLRG